MNDLSDQQLLRDYASRRSESAFTELVRRHIDMVYSAALRLVGDAQAAEDVTQTVFVALARQAPQLTRHPALSGWLHCTTRNVAAKTVRSDVRRLVREKEAAVMNELLANDSTAIWEHIAPHLDAALGELNAAERDAVLLRYFERKSAQEMAQILGVSHEAAQKRVNRGVERLREIFAKHGVSVGVGGLATIISVNAVQAAPAGLVATIATASILSVGSGTFTLMKIMTMTKIKLGISALVVAGAATALVVQHQTQNKLRDENGSLQQQIAQLQTDSENFSNRLAAVGDAKKLPDDQFNELLKLRGEVGVLRRQTNGFGKLQEENQQLALTLKQAESISASKQVLQPTGLEILQQQYMEESNHIEAARSYLDLLRKEYNVTDNSNEAISENRDAAATLAEQPYWDAKHEYIQMMNLHRLLYSKIEMEKLDLQMPNQNGSN